jgi:hypothetical protein
MLPIRDDVLSQDVMRILNKHKIYIMDLSQERKASDMVDAKNELYDLADNIINNCNQLRYDPVYMSSLRIRNLLTHIKNTNKKQPR